MVMGDRKSHKFKHNHHQRWDAMEDSKEHEHDQQQQQQQQHHDHQPHPCSSIEEASTISNGSSSSCYNDDDDDNNSCSSSSSFDTTDDASSSANSSRSSLYDLSDLMSHLPIKRGLSKFYHGKSDSFTSLARVTSIEDLPKKERNPKATSYRSHTLPKPIISKKNSRKKKFPSKTHKGAL